MAGDNDLWRVTGDFGGERLASQATHFRKMPLMGRHSGDDVRKRMFDEDKVSQPTFPFCPSHLTPVNCLTLCASAAARMNIMIDGAAGYASRLHALVGPPSLFCWIIFV